MKKYLIFLLCPLLAHAGPPVNWFGAAAKTLPSVSQVQGPSGTVAVPSYSFIGNTNNGLYEAGPGELALAVGGVSVFRTSATSTFATNFTGSFTGHASSDCATAGCTLSGQLLVAPGSTSPLSVAYSDHTNTGFYEYQPNVTAFQSNGSSTLWMSAAQLLVPSGVSFTLQGQASGVGILSSSGTLTSGQVNLASQVVGNLAVGNLDSGTGANAASVWMGNAHWSVFSEALPACTLSGTNIDWGSACRVYNVTLGASPTYTFSNVTSGRTIVVSITNTASNWTVTWPASANGFAVTWPGGSAPTQTVGAHTDTYTFQNDGVAVRGAVIQNY